MSWARQALHLALKDLVRARWLLVGHLAIVVAAVLPGFWWDGGAFSLPWAMVILLFLVGFVTAATVVQEDPPTRDGAFWGTQPLDPSAVLGSKLLVVGSALLGVALAGQAVGLVGFGIPARDLPVHLGASAAVYGLWLVAAVVLAGAFRTLAAAAAAGLGTVVLSQATVAVVTIVLWMFPFSVPGAVLTAAGRVLYGGSLWWSVGLFGLAVAGYFYHSGRPRRRWKPLAVGAATAALVSALAAGSFAHRGLEPAIPSSEDPLPPELSGVGLEVTRAWLPEGGAQGELMLELATEAPAGPYALRLTPVAFYLVRGDGSTEALSVRLRLRLPTFGTPATAATAWLQGEPRGPGPASAQARVAPTSSQWEALQDVGARIRVEAAVEWLVPEPVGTLPLASGARGGFQGTRIQVLGVSSGNEPVEIRLRAAALRTRNERVAGDPVRDPGLLPELVHVLVHRDSGEGAALVTTPESTSSVGGALGGAPGLPLPGPQAQIAGYRAEALEPLPAGWLDGARLHLYLWVPEGAGRVVTTTEMPPEWELDR